MNIQINSLNTYFFEIIFNDVVGREKKSIISKQHTHLDLSPNEDYVVLRTPIIEYFIAFDIPTTPVCMAVSQVDSNTITSNADLYTRLKTMIIT